jgi:sugar O-acyltransferase (sialic acid O-acetyltransferase NeuD family)
LDIVVVGGSDQGRCTIDLVERTGRDEVVGIIDDTLEPGTAVLDRPVLGGLEQVAELRARHGFAGAVVAIGDNHRRGLVADALRRHDPGLTFATLVDATASVSREVALGEGTVVMAGAIVNVGSTLGRHVLLCAGAQVDHDCTVGDLASLGPGAVTGGNVSIGRCTNVAIGAAVIHGRTIGEETVIGAGSTVIHDIAPFSVAMGTPARVVRTRTSGDTYL